MPAYALTIFLGAFLLFQVQPLIGKYILPWFGGGPSVWTTCMLFFQLLLLGGYAYAHGLTKARLRTQVLVHLALVAGALLLLPVTPQEGWKPHSTDNPTVHILALLAVCVGLPYFVLSATGPLLQHWFTRSYPGVSPYRLYALSNVGSLLALVSFPFVFEPHLTRKAQAGYWGWGLVLYSLACAMCGFRVWPKGAPAGPSQAAERGKERRAEYERPGLLARLLWVALPASASVLLLGVTNKLCQDVAVIPFLWIVPLSLYLLSFIICFEHQRWYQRGPFTLALVAALAGLCIALQRGSDWGVWQQVAIYSGALFICCMVCHGELYRLRPAPARLTSFYLAIAAGGALGGVFVALAAPVLFSGYYGLHWGMFSCAALLVLICCTENTVLLSGCGAVAGRRSTDESGGEVPGAAGKLRETGVAVSGGPRLQWPLLACALPLVGIGGLEWFMSHVGEQSRVIPKHYLTSARAVVWGFVALMVVSWFVRGRSRPIKHWRLVACLWLLLGLAGLSLVLWSSSTKKKSERIYTSRNFYGVLSVLEYRKDDPAEHYYLLQHGRITHGLQFTDPQQAKWPTSYYSPQSGVALALNATLPGDRRLGVVGLGTGSLAAFARPGDYVKFYEINPEVERVANSPFTYLSNCAGKVEVALGDARLSMEREGPQNFDLLALDAFSGDAIPVHLLTREAFELYQRHLKPHGVIAVHISNHYLDLQPVVANLAREFDYRMAVIDYDENEEEWWLYSSTWVLLTRDAYLLMAPEIAAASAASEITTRSVPLWTDAFASLFQILK